MKYYIADGNNRRGPFELEELAAQGLRPDMLVWREGMADWQPASTLAELASSLPQGSAAPGPVPLPPTASYPAPSAYPQAPGGYPGYNASSVNSTKIAAGLCGILLGGLGVHKFVLGMTTAGLIQIVITFVTCGVGSIIGLVEGIIYLTKSDEEFYRTYVVEKKSWF